MLVNKIMVNGVDQAGKIKLTVAEKSSTTMYTTDDGFGIQFSPEDGESEVFYKIAIIDNVPVEMRCTTTSSWHVWK